MDNIHPVFQEVLRPFFEKKPWWQTVEKLPDFVKVGNKVYPIDDAISLGKMTTQTEPATKEEYDYQENNKTNF